MPNMKALCPEIFSSKNRALGLLDTDKKIFENNIFQNLFCPSDQLIEPTKTIGKYAWYGLHIHVSCEIYSKPVKVFILETWICLAVALLKE